jgi:hypothetical protein
MSSLDGSSLGGPRAVGGDGVSALSVVSRSARVYDNVSTQLERLREAAVEKGDTVTLSRVDLEYQPVGHLLVATSGEAQFNSAQPPPTPHVDAPAAAPTATPAVPKAAPTDKKPAPPSQPNAPLDGKSTAPPVTAASPSDGAKQDATPTVAPPVMATGPDTTHPRLDQVA